MDKSFLKTIATAVGAVIGAGLAVYTAMNGNGSSSNVNYQGLDYYGKEAVEANAKKEILTSMLQALKDDTTLDAKTRKETYEKIMREVRWM